MYVYRMSIIKKPEGTHRVIQDDTTIQHWFEGYMCREDHEPTLKEAFDWFVFISASIQKE